MDENTNLRIIASYDAQRPVSPARAVLERVRVQAVVGPRLFHVQLVIISGRPSSWACVGDGRGRSL